MSQKILVSDKMVASVRCVIEQRLTKIGEIRTWEVTDACMKAGVAAGYKTIGRALAIIMYDLEQAGIASKIRLGCWYIKRPEAHSFAHPIDDVREAATELQLKCKRVRQELGRNPSEKQILDACENAGISVQTLLNEIRRMK
jgi:hypothetical protein